MAVKQSHDETIRDYLKRFNVAALEVKDLNDEWAIQAFITGVRHKYLKYALTDTQPTKLYQLYEKAQKYAEAEEIEIASRRAETWNRETSGTRGVKNNRFTDRPGTRNQREGPAPSGQRSPSRKRPWPGPHAKYDSYTPLTAPRSQILNTIKSEGLLERPPPMLGDRSGRDHTKRCDFHNDIGHTTDDCYCLRNAIEALVRKGAIRQFVKKEAHARNITKTQEERRSNANRRPVSGVINVIVSSDEIWANSKSKRKSHLRSVMAVDVATKRPKHSD